MKTINKTYLVTALAAAATVMVPQMATAADKGQVVSASSSSAQSSLERRLQLMEQELQSLRAEVARSRAETKAEVKASEEKVQAKQAAVEEELVAHEKEKKNMIFFRGGYADMVHGRSNQVFTDLYGKDNNIVVNNGREGTYFGAGLDYSISDDLFGLTDQIEFLGEVMFDWKRWDSQVSTSNGAQAVVPTAAYVLGVNPNLNHTKGVTMSQFTLSASPKLKFLKGSAFRPWIIPVGMAFNVISPPSDAGTVLAPGAIFGIGFDYNIWQNLFVGLDGRYNLVAHEVDGVEPDHYEIGGYVGFGF